MAVRIPLSKQGKHAGKYEAIVSDEDGDLSSFAWAACHASNGVGIYAERRPNGKRLAMHRVILERVLGRPLEKHEFADHIDNNGLNNCRENLRIATSQQNAMNRKKTKANKTGFKGVSFSRRKKNPYRAIIYHEGKKISLGVYATEEDAYKAYCDAQIVYHRGFSNKG